jgi:Flp pilus assembly protein TadG
MTAVCFLKDEQGNTAIEFGLTAPLFFMFLFAIVEAGMLIWTQVGLQHAAETAARCATVNKTICGDVQSIQSYAVKQAFGMEPPASTFQVVASSCGNLVTANYNYGFVTSFFGMPKFALTAQSCFPK